MLTLACNIRIGDYVLREAESIRVNSSWDKLTDTCTIKLPRRMIFGGKPVAVGGPWKRGDQVRVFFGYAPRYDQRFTGYLTVVQPGDTITLECEDDLWKLKQNSHSFYWKSCTLQEVLSKVSPIPFKCTDIQLGSLRVDRVSTARVLATLQTEYNLPSFVRDGVLYVGLRFWPELQSRVVVRLGVNTAAESLEWYDREAVDIEVIATSIVTVKGKKGSTREKKITAKAGVPGGDKRSMHFYNITSEAELKKAAERELERLRFTGYRGSFTLFGVPLVRHGDRILLEDDLYREHYGEYLVKSVESQFGSGGVRQKVELDARIA